MVTCGLHFLALEILQKKVVLGGVLANCGRPREGQDGAKMGATGAKMEQVGAKMGLTFLGELLGAFCDSGTIFEKKKK